MEHVPATPRPSAAVVLARETGEAGMTVFMVRRHVQSEFVPDVFVFPGGSVAAADREVESMPSICTPAADGPAGLGSGFRVAALRECFEEAGVLLARRDGAPLALRDRDNARFAGYRAALQHGAMRLDEIAAREGLTLATDLLLHWSHWITPEAWPKRFDTHFFLATMPEEQEAAHDRMETTAGIWVTPREALGRHEQGEFPLVFATLHQLRTLAEVPTIAAAHERFAGAPVRTMRPYIVVEDGKDAILLPDEL